MSKFDGAESLGDIVKMMEDENGFWENALDQYQNYTYHIELFVVDVKTARDFLNTEHQNIDTIISNGWPSTNDKYITIAETGSTTEFVLEDLNVQSFSAGAGSVSKLAGTATSLDFSIVQIGNTSLADNLHNVALLSGYANLSDAIYFIKINFSGYNESYDIVQKENQNLTKVLPFKINNVGDVPTSTDSRGTVTSIQGTIVQDYATSTSVNTIKNNFDFDIKDTLEETVNSFIEALNESVRKHDYSVDTGLPNPFVHNYTFVLDEDFKTQFGQSPMNGDDPNNGYASNEVSTKTGAVNLSTQKGTVQPGLSIVDIIYDICIQSLDVRTELTKENESFTSVVQVSPTAVPILDGFNVLTGESGHEVNYFISTRRMLVTQNNFNSISQLENSGKIIKEIFDKNRCKKIYYNTYTGLNDQILEFNVSLNRQLIKAFNTPSDSAFAKRFIDGNREIIEDLNPRARQRIEEIQQQHSSLEGDRTQAVENVDSVKREVEAQSEAITQELVNRQRNQLASYGLGPAVAEATAGSLKNMSISQQLATVQQYDPDEGGNLASVKDSLNRYNELVDSYNQAERKLNDIQREQSELDKERRDVITQSLGANLSRDANMSVSSLAQNFQNGIVDSDSNRILLEDISDDLISRLSTEQLEAIMDSLIMNPTIFTNSVLPYLVDEDKKHIRIYSSSSEKEIRLAKEKFYEGIRADISMEQANLTIKGDPYWLDTYLTAETARKLFSDTNGIDRLASHPTELNGTNHVVIVTNKAAGVDENDNIKIANLSIMLFAVVNINNSFSGGQFVQQLIMRRVPVPESFKPVNPFFSTVEIDTREELLFQQPVEIAEGVGSGNTGTIVPMSTLENPNNLPIGAGGVVVEDPNGNVGVKLDPETAFPSAAASLKNAVVLLKENDGVPTQEQATQYYNVRNQMKAMCDMQYEAACVELAIADNEIMSQVVNNIADGPPYDTDRMITDINDAIADGDLDVSAGGIAVIQETMENKGYETFNADDITGMTQVEVDTFLKNRDDASKSFYVGTEGVIENPVDAMTDISANTEFGRAAAKDLLNSDEPFDPRGSKFRARGSRTGMADRSINTEVPPNTLTPNERDKVVEIQQEIASAIREKPLTDMSEAEYNRVKQLERAAQGVVDNATTGTRGEIRDAKILEENRKAMDLKQQEVDELQEDVEDNGWFEGRRERERDAEQLAELEQELLAIQNDNSPVVMDDVVRIVNPETGEPEIQPVYKLEKIDNVPVVVNTDAPLLGVPNIDNGDGTFTVPSTVREGSEFLTQTQASQLDSASSVYDNVYTQIENLPRKDVTYSYTHSDGRVETWTESLPDTSAIQPIEYVDANGQTQTVTPQQLGITPGETITAATLSDVMSGISDLYPLIEAGAPKETSSNGVLRTDLGTRFYVLEEEE